MNCILLEPADLDGDPARQRATITGRRARHVVQVLRAQPGQRVRVGLVGGRLGSATVATLATDSTILDAIELDADPPPPVPVTLCVALPRPKSLRRVLFAATTLGVKSIVIMETWRVDKSYWQSPLLAPDATRRVLIVALEQSVDTVLPNVEMKRRFRPFAEDEVPALVRGTTAVLAHPTATEPMPSAVSGPITLFVGPDRGFTPFEVDLLARQGALPRRLGPRVLRVDDAVPALLGALAPR